MKLGLNLLLWTGHVTSALYPDLIKVKKAGFDGVEVPIMEGDTAHYAALGAFLRNEGLECTAVTMIPDRARNPASAERQQRQAGLDYLRQRSDWAAAMGADLLIGPYHSPLGVFTGTGPTDAERNWVAEVHRDFADHAAAQGITLAVEWLNRFECYFLTTMADAVNFAKLVERPNYFTMLDTFHSHIEEKNVAASIWAAQRWIRHVHVSENDRGTPGQGQVNFPAAFRALQDLGYDRWLMIEAFGRSLPELAAATCVWRDFFHSPEQVYLEGGPYVRDTWAAATQVTKNQI